MRRQMPVDVLVLATRRYHEARSRLFDVGVMKASLDATIAHIEADCDLRRAERDLARVQAWIEAYPDD